MPFPTRSPRSKPPARRRTLYFRSFTFRRAVSSTRPRDFDRMLGRLLQSPVDDARAIFRVAGVPLRLPLIAEMANGHAVGRDCPPARRIASGDDLVGFIRVIVGDRFEHRLVLHSI